MANLTDKLNSLIGGSKVTMGPTTISGAGSDEAKNKLKSYAQNDLSKVYKPLTPSIPTKTTPKATKPTPSQDNSSYKIPKTPKVSGIGWK